jgi:hypothetical protein
MMTAGYFVLIQLKQRRENLRHFIILELDGAYQLEENQYLDLPQAFILHLMSQKSSQK